MSSYTVRHELITRKVGETIEIEVPIIDRDGVEVNLNSATAIFKIGRRRGDEAILTKEDGDGITFGTGENSHVATVTYNTDELVGDEDQQLTGKFWEELKIIKDGVGLYVLEGPLVVDKVIE